MKKSTQFAAFFCLFILVNNLYGQEADKVVVNQEHLDKLILSAIVNSSLLDQQQVEIETFDYQKKIINNEHSGLFVVSGNLNEYSIRELSGDQSTASFYPRYNVGVSISLNHFSNVKNRKKLLELDQKMTLMLAEDIEKSIAEDVTKKYISYLKQKNILNIKKTLEQFSVADFNALEKKFSEGEAELNEYNAARRDFYSAKMDVIEAESQYLTTKTELEAAIHTTLKELKIE